MTLTADFDANPRGITESQTVRFIDKSVDTVYTITAWDWDWGDGTAHGTTQTPLHTYPNVGVDTYYDVVLTVTNSHSDTDSETKTRFITQRVAASIPAPTTAGLYEKASILIYSDTESMLLNRTQVLSNLVFYGISYRMMLDRGGVAKFNVFDDGTATAAEKHMLNPGYNVAVIMGKAVVFSGRIKRGIQTLQPDYLDTTGRIQLWTVECESDITKLSSLNLDSTKLSASGTPLHKSVGSLAEDVLYSAINYKGYIDIVDASISYQLNSSNNTESCGSKLNHMNALQLLSNYDMRARLDYERYNYNYYNASVTTITGAAFTINEFQNYYMLFTSDNSITLTKTFTTPFPNEQLWLSQANTFFAVDDRVCLTTTGTLPSGFLTTVLYYIKTTTTDYVTISLTSGGAAVTFGDSGSGTHSINKVTTNVSGVLSYGLITSNTADTITCTMYGAGSVTTTGGTVLILKNLKVDFAKDISQPSSVASYNVNGTIFGYNDKEDNKKAVSKVVVKGKDLGGTTLTVSLSAVHAWNNTDQFFNDCTYITHKNEGCVYKNSYVTKSKNITPALGGEIVCSTDYATYPTNLFVANDPLVFTTGMTVQFTSSITLPAPLVAGTTYYVIDPVGGHIHISTTLGGSVITFTTDGVGTHYIAHPSHASNYSYFGYDNTDGAWRARELVTTSSTTTPTGLTDGAYYWIHDDLTVYGSSLYYSINPDLNLTITTVGSGVKMYKLTDVVNPGPTTSGYIWLYGRGYLIPTGTVLTLTLPYSASYINVTTTGSPVEETQNDGTQTTRLQLTKMLCGEYNFAGQGFCMSSRLWVKDKTKVYTSGTVTLLAGEEPVSVTASGTDTTYGDYLTCSGSARIMSTSLKAYPHSVGCLVAQTNYTEASPETDSAYKAIDIDHPLQIGPIIDTPTVDTNVMYSDLDVYAIQMLVGNSYYYKKAKGYGAIFDIYVKDVGLARGATEPSQISLVCPPRVGDRISIVPYSGATPIEYQIVIITVNIDAASLEMNMGDYEKNMFLFVSKQTAINRGTT